MIATLTIGTNRLYLAGGNGRQSEAVGLSVTPQPVVQSVTYVGAVEARQIPRAGMLTTVSFQSSTEFQSLQAAEYFIQQIPSYLTNLNASTFFLGSLNSLGQTQQEVAAASNPDDEEATSGNVTVTITSSILDSSPLTLQVPILAGDYPETWGPKVIAAMIKNGDIATHYNVRQGANPTLILLTARTAAANDTTLNISIANGTPSPGIQEQPTSDSLRLGIAPTFFSSMTLYEAFPVISATQFGITVNLSVSVTGRITA